jgi:hypothetical protein
LERTPAVCKAASPGNAWRHVRDRRAWSATAAYRSFALMTSLPPPHGRPIGLNAGHRSGSHHSSLSNEAAKRTDPAAVRLGPSSDRSVTRHPRQRRWSNRRNA